ncbi:PREDICTED: uncharacterized protein LOC104762352 isoform X2 [Camelina sativa]|uniref:Uncharacterized protein LOC104762352 isoform X1 n=1 Tax=Camelina sativa TaxID=90675 RepID=A0ABM0XCK2_CAMSA|nr:PREDICTED: uncharacterized protein LOC104762352 isoform X1 [Camelina sativa]XP_010483926.1 PREDICTED: uncharacterized protein LOC104762352 isoform X2 [Camelina sativa]
MGRDWSWLGGGKKKSSSKSKKEEIKTPPPPPPSSSLAENTGTAAGCMSAVFNIFDLQHLQFPINHHHLHLPKGVDAPRNSFESTEEETTSSSTRKDGNLNISMGIKIKTKPQARSSLTATESYSPSIKTPTLVARLMGLDLVPDNYRSSPTPSSSSSSNLIDLKTPTRSSYTKKHRHYSLQRNSVDGGTRSLPETPRISLGRRSVDVNCSYEHQRSSFHHRDNNNNSALSGINNVKLTRVKEMKIHEDKENRSPREYARQIVMQLKENVSRRRRMGTDITNKEQQSREETHDSKKASSKITIITHDSSPRVGLTEIPKTKQTSLQKNNVASKNLETTTVKVQDKNRLPTVQEELKGTEQEKQRKSTKKCKKPENFKSRLVKPPQTMQEEPFVRPPATTSNNNNGLLLIQGDKSSNKKTPLSINHLINFTSVPTIKKKDSSPHHKSSNVKVRETQTPRNRASSTELPSFASQSQPHIAPTAGGELEYITRTLRRTGIDRDTPISYAKWFSPSHPLDPSIFYFLEHFAVTSTRPSRSSSPENLALRCNRKLLFHLADEILADILKPHINLKPWLCRYSTQSQRNLKGSELIDELSRRIERFPLAKCLVLEDIDALVAGDFPETESAFEEDGEGIVTEIERGIFETLVTETTADYFTTWMTKTAPLKRNDDVSGTWGVHVTRYSSKVGSHHDSFSRRLRLPRG